MQHQGASKQPAGLCRHNEIIQVQAPYLVRPPGYRHTSPLCQNRRVVAVVLDWDERSVWVVILVEPTKGFSTCQDNPAFPFEVDLGAPLGDRRILDASVYPPERVWP